MTKDILKLSATLLGLDDVYTYLSSETNQVSPEINKKIDDLIVYLNYILREITKEYYPLKHKEKLISSNQCEIFYNTFSFQPLAIKDIKNHFNDSVTFNIYPEYLKVGKPNEEYIVEYNYYPNQIKNVNDRLNLPIGLEPFIICYGIASEFALSRLLYSEAEMWEGKFKNSLDNFKSRIGERRFFARRLK